MSDVMWNNEEPVKELGIDVPRWIEQDISPSDVAAILQGGCASGAYMPAVTYHQALATMSEHGDDVWSFIDDHYGLDWFHSQADPASSWSGLACAYVSFAVEMWASSVEDEIREVLEEEEAA